MHRVGKYLLKKKIGEGAFAEVRLAVHTETGIEYAVKVFDRRSLPTDEFERDVRKEIRIMQCLNHPNIVTVHAVLVTDRNLYLVMELVRGGELYEHIVSQKRVDEDTSRKYFQQIVDALVYCHKQGVYHRDLKPENLLLDEYGRIKITDFGMSFMKENRSSEKQLLHTQCGTAKYMPPEIIVRSKKGYDGAKLDAWECGMVLFALLAGHLPFNGDDDKSVFKSILNNELVVPSYISPGARVVLRLLLEKNPKKRASLVDIRNNPWFRIGYEGNSCEPTPGNPLELSHLQSAPVTPQTPTTEEIFAESTPYAAMKRGVVAPDRNKPGGLPPINPDDFGRSIPSTGDEEDSSNPPDSGNVDSSEVHESTFRSKLSSFSDMIFRGLRSPRKIASRDTEEKSSNDIDKDEAGGWFAESPASVMEAGLQGKQTFMKSEDETTKGEQKGREGQVTGSKLPRRGLRKRKARKTEVKG